MFVISDYSVTCVNAIFKVATLSRYTATLTDTHTAIAGVRVEHKAIEQNAIPAFLLC